MTDLRDNKRFWGMGEVLAMSVPAGLGMLMPTLIRFVDAWMVSYTGPTALGAQMTAGMTAFVLESFPTGLLGVVNTYVSQNLGAGRPDLCGRYAWAGLCMSLAFCLLVAPLAFLGPTIFQLMGHEKDLIPLEAMYFAYMVAAIFLTLTARPLEQFFYGIRRPNIVLASTIASNIVNIVLGYLLIFGRSGFIIFQHNPSTAGLAHALSGWFTFDGMGLRGAAIAALVSWAIYLGILALNFLGPSINRQFHTRDMLAVRWRHVRDLLRIGWPAGTQFLGDVLPWNLMLTLLIAPLGDAHLAASAIAMRWMPLSFMPAVGIGVATTALVGRYIGQGRPDLAKRRAHAALVLALLYMGACGVAFWFLREPMVRLFVTILPTPEITPEKAVLMAGQIVSIGQAIMICAAVFQLFDAVGIIFIGGLRGAGDTFWPMVAVLLLSFAVTLGGGWLAVRFVPQWTSIGPWVAGSAYVVLLGIVLIWRFESAKWRRINLLGQAGPPVV